MKFEKGKREINRRLGRSIYYLLKEYNQNILKISAIKQMFKENQKELGKLIHATLWAYDQNLFCFNPVRVSGNNITEENVKLYEPYMIESCKIGKGTYIAMNSIISGTNIGNFCSIGPNFTCGYGIHPVNGISTSPCFYSTKMQNGMTYTNEDKVIERKEINIGNDVFIGMNVSILDGITIGDGAVIGAGAVVTKDVAPFSIVCGVPAKHIRYRFSEEQVEKLLKIQWWNWDDEKLKRVEKNFFDIDKFLLENS